MLVQIHSDKNLTVHADLIASTTLDVETTLARFGNHLTRAEVHLSDESAGRPTGDDIRCLIEARPAGQQPVVASDQASTLEAALAGALAKITALLDSKFDRIDSAGSRETIRGN